MDIRSIVIELSYAIRNAVLPHLGRQASKRSEGITPSGDVEFAIDEIAEHTIADFINENDLPVAYYSEGRGLVKHRTPEHLLVIDPIDGTRPAMVGLDGGTVSIAVAPYSTNACIADVIFGSVLELKVDRLYTASKGGITRVTHEGRHLPITLTTMADLDRISWSYESAGRPVEIISRALSGLIDRSSIRGGVFQLNGSAFSLTRIVTGQFDAVIDVGGRILHDRPDLRDNFVRAGLGSPIGIFPYDIAAAVLILETAGCTVTNAHGDSLGATPLLDTSEQNISSLVAASNPVLHRLLLAELDASLGSLG